LQYIRSQLFIVTPACDSATLGMRVTRDQEETDEPPDRDRGAASPRSLDGHHLHRGSGAADRAVDRLADLQGRRYGPGAPVDVDRARERLRGGQLAGGDDHPARSRIRPLSIRRSRLSAGEPSTTVTPWRMSNLRPGSRAARASRTISSRARRPCSEPTGGRNALGDGASTMTLPAALRSRAIARIDRASSSARPARSLNRITTSG